MVNLNALTRRIDKLRDDGDAERYQAAWNRFCDDQGEPRIDMAGARGIEELLQFSRVETGHNGHCPD